jgi:hypothetical protein
MRIILSIPAPPQPLSAAGFQNQASGEIKILYQKKDRVARVLLAAPFSTPRRDNNAPQGNPAEHVYFSDIAGGQSPPPGPGSGLVTACQHPAEHQRKRIANIFISNIQGIPLL